MNLSLRMLPLKQVAIFLLLGTFIQDFASIMYDITVVLVVAYCFNVFA